MARARSTALAGLAISIVFAAGCGSPEPEPEAPAATQAPAPPAAAPAEPPRAATPEAPAPAAPRPEEAGRLPSDFPPDVPQYPGSRVAEVRSGGGDGSFAVTFESPDSVDAVAKFYEEKLAISGWQAHSMVSPEGTMVMAQKGGRQAQAFVQEGGQGTVVVMVIAEGE